MQIQYIEPEKNTFTSLVVDITHRCNMECANCYIPNRSIPDMDIGSLDRFLARLPYRTYIRLIGAEPTMREDLTDIIRMVIKRGHKPSLTTNGLKLAHMDYVQELQQAGLKMVLLSMNGADDDEVYKRLDNGKYATLKVRALRNLFRAGITINTGTIIAKDVNEHTVRRQVDLFAEVAAAEGVHLDRDKPWNRITPVLRMKSVGLIGRSMEGACHYDLPDLAQVVADQLGRDANEIMSQQAISGTNLGIYHEQRDLYANRYKLDTPTSMMFSHDTAAGALLIRLIDWSVDEDGVPDRGNENRGRITQDWKVAPFFEHVKLNEGGY